MATSFTLQVEQWSERALRRGDVIFRKIALDMFTRVVLRSPVDTGRFRGNWMVAIGHLPTETVERFDKTGANAISRINSAVSGLRLGQAIYLANSLPYARRLEHGWSKQAPAGMVGVTVREFQPIVEKLART